MAFDTYSNDGEQQSGSTGDSPKVDYNALNKYVAETANLQNKEVLIGYISSIIDLGLQPQEDGKVVWTGSAEDEAAAITEEAEKYGQSNSYFEDGIDPKTKNPTRYKRWPKKPAQAVAFAVDFPDIILDKGQFYGESKPLPLRMYLGGEYWDSNARQHVMQRPFFLEMKKEQGVWSFAKNSTIYKMATAAKIVAGDGSFVKQNIDELLGKRLQFQVEIKTNESGGKTYLNEYIAFASGLGRGMKELDVVTPLSIVQFNQENTEESLVNIRNHVTNTMRRATNWEGSKVKDQLEAISKARGDKPSESDAAADEVNAPSKPAETKPVRSKPTPPPVEDFDDDIPF